MKKIFSTLLTIISLIVSAQNVGIGTATPDVSAKLDVQSTNGGVLLPRMNKGQRDAIVNPANGLLIYNTDNNALEMWNGNAWISFSSIGILNNGLPVGATCTGTWSAKADVPGTARFSAVGFTIGNKGYITTGNDGVYRKDTWQYDPLTNTWTQKADFPGSGRTGAVGFSVAGKGYVGPGYNGSAYLSD